MSKFEQAELEEAARSIESMLHKCEQAPEKLIVYSAWGEHAYSPRRVILIILEYFALKEPLVREN